VNTAKEFRSQQKKRDCQKKNFNKRRMVHYEEKYINESMNATFTTKKRKRIKNKQKKLKGEVESNTVEHQKLL
jgi:hypothetical protein